MSRGAETAQTLAGVRTVPRPHFRYNPDRNVIRLPVGRRLGSVLAIDIGPDGHIWLLHQSDGADERTLPPVVEFTPDGEFVAAWGGSQSVESVDGVSQWPVGHEGIEVDDDGAVWIFGYGPGDHAALRFSREGKLLLRIGEREKPGDDRSRTHLNRATSAWHDVANREVFVADGYGNHRIVAFNSDTGEFTRMWGAYAKDPTALSPQEGFGNPVHKITRGPNGLLYVVDRSRNRVQEFEISADRVGFRREVVIAPGTAHYGSAFDIDFAPGDDFMYVSDGTNNRVWIIDVASFEVLGWTGSYADEEGSGNTPAFFGLIHRFKVTPEGNILLCRPGKGLHVLEYGGVW
jgi:hypothetical protein